MPNSVEIRDYHCDDEESLMKLRQRCGLTRPWNNPQLDIARKLEGQPDWLLVAVMDDRIVASVMVGYDGHRGWIHYLAVAPEQQRAGIGQAMMAEGEHRLRAIGCPKINLQVRADNTEAVAFYRSIGFQQDNVLSFGKRLVDDEHPSQLRSRSLD